MENANVEVEDWKKKNLKKNIFLEFFFLKLGSGGRTYVGGRL